MEGIFLAAGGADSHASKQHTFQEALGAPFSWLDQMLPIDALLKKAN